MSGILDFWQDVLAQGGTTHNINKGEVIANNGYFVSLDKFGEVNKLDAYYTPNNKLILNFIDRNRSELNKENRYLRGWIENDNLYLDITTFVLNKRDAIQLAYRNNQQAIYDNLNKVVISLPSPQRSGTITQQKSYLTSVIDRLCK